MPKINVYLPDDLAEAVRATGVPVSSICQRALEAAVREAKTVTITPSFERFTPRARAVVSVAADLAAAEEVDLGSEHVLRALLTGDGIAARSLEALGVSDELVTRAVAQRSSTADGSAIYLASLQEALKLGHNYIGTEHMLLGIASTPGTAADVLSDLGVTASGLRSHVISTLTNLGIPAPVAAAQEPGLATKLDELITRLDQLERKLSS